MVAKKKTKGDAASKAKSAVKKITKKVAAKKSAKRKAGKKAKKSIAKPKTKRTVVKSPVTPITTHGEDLYLIPITGEIHPARIGEAKQFEKMFKHNEETTLHMEQQRAKQIMATNRGGGKRIFKNPRHS